MKANFPSACAHCFLVRIRRVRCHTVRCATLANRTSRLLLATEGCSSRKTVGKSLLALALSRATDWQATHPTWSETGYAACPTYSTRGTHGWGPVNSAFPRPWRAAANRASRLHHPSPKAETGSLKLRPGTDAVGAGRSSRLGVVPTRSSAGRSEARASRSSARIVPRSQPIAQRCNRFQICCPD